MSLDANVLTTHRLAGVHSQEEPTETKPEQVKVSQGSMVSARNNVSGEKFTIAVADCPVFLRKIVLARKKIRLQPSCSSKT